MRTQDPQIDGPQVLIPGSDFLLSGLGRLMLLLGFVVLVLLLVLAARRKKLGRKLPLFGASALLVIGLALTVAYLPPPFFVPEFPALPALLPAEALFYRPISDLPVAAQSAQWIDSQNGQSLSAGFRGSVTDGVAFGLPFNLVDAQTDLNSVELTQYPAASFAGPYPITDPAYIEGLPTYHFDQHYLAVDLERRQAWELIAIRSWFGHWQAGAGATWSMDSLDYPTGSTIAARMPLLPGTITFEEVQSGAIDHVILGSTSISAPGKFVWPARGGDGVSSDPNAPPMGAWLRLSADADLSGLGPQSRVVAQAAQKYGVILSDTGPG
ncbi:MAG: hypothetical protein WD029_06445, partial [Microthrixaceae bacterium]